MLPVQVDGTSGPTVVMLHWLGGSGRSWAALSRVLVARGLRCARVDLPGFGDAADDARYDVGSMAEAVSETIRGLSLQGQPWLLAGHSMGGKVAALVARDALDGAAGLEGLRGLVLVSPSPTGPEPMAENQRAKMLRALGQSSGDAKQDQKRAAEFVDENVGKLALPETLHASAVADVLRMSRAAFRAWLEQGSREDWRARVGPLELPALVFAGSQEPALGPEAQREHTLPHMPQASLVTLQGAGHLGPLERPDEVAAHVLEFVFKLGLELQPEIRTLRTEFQELMLSAHTSPQTRALMLQRLALDGAAVEGVLDAAARRTLRVLVESVVPDAGFDLADRVEALLASGTTDGTQADALPPGADAWRLGLLSLDAAAQRAHGLSFLALDAERRSRLLQGAARGELGKGLLGSVGLGNGAELYTAAQMKLWFEEVRGVVVKVFVADPRTLDRMGFAGFADDPHGFTRIRLGEPGEFAA
jgi:pimeloyl-ACP methyl ester carboxylesterase